MTPSSLPPPSEVPRAHGVASPASSRAHVAALPPPAPANEAREAPEAPESRPRSSLESGPTPTPPGGSEPPPEWLVALDQTTDRILDGDHFALPGMLHVALRTGGTVQRAHWQGWPPAGDTPEAVMAAAQELMFGLDLRLIYEPLLLKRRTRDTVPGQRLYVGQYTWFWLGRVPHDPEQIQFDLISASADEFNALCEFCREYIQDRAPDEPEDDTGRGPLHTIVQTPRGYDLVQLGYGGRELEPENYPTEVVEALVRVQQNVQSASPSGRITVISGPPGTGKSHLWYALLNTPGATFVLVDASLVESLSGPALLPLLANVERRGPLVLIVEEADHLLRERDDSNMKGLAALLSFGSVLGDLLNLHVILITNAPLRSMDQALRRDERLVEHIELAPLTPEHARRIYQRLVKRVPDDVDLPERHQHLGCIYKWAKAQGWVPPPDGRTFPLLSQGDYVARAARVAKRSTVKRPIGFLNG